MMSSNIKILKICEYCRKDFIAKKTTSKTCSDDCAKRLYKMKIRNEKINQATLQTEIIKQAKAFITVSDLQLIQAKDILTLKEAAILLNISPLTLRRWVFAGKIQSTKTGKKHQFNRASLQTL
ncbi:MAG: excisionase family DNA-binding protein [Chitinophagales bacterium]|nr:excisionase family DNA-binding protein [Chitinophagales bacterium]